MKKILAALAALIESIKPNVITITVIGSVFISQVSGSMEKAAISSLAMVFLGGIVSVLFFLVGPAPNPMIPASIVNRTIRMLSGNASSAELSEIEKSPFSRDGVIVCLIVISGMVVLYLAHFTKVSDAAVLNLAAFYIGMIASAIGKMSDPDATQEKVPQSSYFRLLDLLEKQLSRKI